MKINTHFNRCLFCCFLFIATMIFARIKYSGSIRFVFLIWNLFLAYIPFLLSEFLEKIFTKAKWKQVLLFIGWLLFFPNALYIITDIIHLEEIKPVPVWFDAILLFTSSFVGLALAFASLMNVVNFLKKYLSPNNVKLVRMGLLFAGAFGVYLGRFQRWNSWNIIDDPFALISDIGGRFIHPFSHTRSWMVIIFFAVTYELYWFLFKYISKINLTDKDVS
jgi:uncharacterized membrane protein